MQRLDRRGAIAFIDVARGEASCPIDRRELLARFHADENGHLLSGAAAFAAMWRAIPILRPFGSPRPQFARAWGAGARLPRIS